MTTNPSARTTPAMAYDQATGQMVLFGGYNGSTYLGDTWQWSAVAVTAISPIAGPLAGGTSVTITGTAITPLASTATDSSIATITAWSATGLPTGLPTGLSIAAATGTISGTPTAAGSYGVTLVATDSAGAMGAATFTWAVTSPVVVPSGGGSGGGGFGFGAPQANTITVTDPGSQSAMTGAAIPALANKAQDASVGTPVTWSATGLPPGLAIDPDGGTITGWPTTAGPYTVAVTASDGTGASGSTTFTWVITSPITVTNPGDRSSRQGTAITPLVATASDTTTGATITWSASGLPTGLSIAPATGTVTGTPQAARPFTVILTATDSSGFSGQANFTWTITASGLSISPGSLPTGEVGAAYGMTMAAPGLTAPGSWSVSAGSLPAGLSLGRATGAIGGKPAAAGQSTFTVTVTDGAGQTASQSYTLTVVAASPGRPGLSGTPGIMASTPSGHGYWLVASDGGIFTYGDAHFYGSTARRHLAKPVVGMTATPDGKGYRLMEKDGGVFTYGDATFYGSGA